MFSLTPIYLSKGEPLEGKSFGESGSWMKL